MGRQGSDPQSIGCLSQKREARNMFLIKGQALAGSQGSGERERPVRGHPLGGNQKSLSILREMSSRKRGIGRMWDPAPPNKGRGKKKISTHIRGTVSSGPREEQYLRRRGGRREEWPSAKSGTLL